MNTRSWHWPKPVWRAPVLRARLSAALVLATLELVIVLGFLAWSVSCGDWSWFPRSGAAVTALAALDILWRGRHARLQPLSAAGGSLIWGFGDLLG